LIDEGIPAQNIIYISVETPIYNNIYLEQLFNLAKRALGKPEVDDSQYYVLFDEVQYLKDWEVNLKSLVDTYRNVKYIASGSAAAELKKKSNESGAGRFTDFNLPPLTFYEYIQNRLNGRMRDGIVTDLLVDISRDKDIKEGMTAQEIVNHIRWSGACAGAMEALTSLVKSYRLYCHQKGLEREEVTIRYVGGRV
jgi:predicted AAA+ superfamily ATPase